MKKTLLFFAVFVSFNTASAQLQPLEILKTVADNIRSFKNISFETSSVDINPFSTGDTSYINSKVIVAYDDLRKIRSMIEHNSINDGQIVYDEIFNKGTLYSVNLIDSTFTFKPGAKAIVSSKLTSLEEQIRNEILKDPTKIIMKKDTLVNGTKCYNFLYKSYDSVENGNHNYIYKTLAINKSTLLPVYIKDTGAGTMAKGGIVIGRVKTFNETRYMNYKLNQTLDPSVFEFNQSRFDKPNDKMLASGDTAPDLNLVDTNNSSVPASVFKNRFLLLEFGSTACAANPLAHPMLNRLYKKYSSSDLAIASIYTTEGLDQVKKYIASNNLLFPVYTATRRLAKEYKTLGTPNFTLLIKKERSLKVLMDIPQIWNLHL